MNVCVLKFGGAILKDESDRLIVINKVKKKLESGCKVIVVVSAMGRYNDPYATDTLIEHAKFLEKKDKDRLISLGEIISTMVLANQIAQENIRTHPVSEKELGIYTNSEWGKGKVISLNPLRLNKLLNLYDVLVVPGFIGVNKNGDVVTLGRGGSDFSAVLIAHMLGIGKVEFYKDVEGVLSGNPKYIKNPRKYDYLSYNQMLLLSENGAQILQKNAILAARNYNIELEVLPIYSNDVGTTISLKGVNENYLAIMNENDCINIIGNYTNEEIELIKKMLNNNEFEYELTLLTNVIKIDLTKGSANELSNYLHEELIRNHHTNLGIYLSGDVGEEKI